MKYVHKSALFDIEIAQDDGQLCTIHGDIPYKKNHVICTDQYGNKQVMIKHVIDEFFVPVEVKEKPKIDYESMAEGYADISNWDQEEDEEYINKTLDLIKNKAF